jgi:transposase-like protein
LLNRLLTFAIVLGIAYFLLTRFGPLRQPATSGSGSGPGASPEDDKGRCVELAVDANDSLTRVARQYGQPPVDIEAWASAQWSLESEIQSAESACYCASQACRDATSALAEMRQLLSNLDGMVRGTSPGFANPANQQARIYDLLDQAKAGSGN